MRKCTGWVECPLGDLEVSASGRVSVGIVPKIRGKRIWQVSRVSVSISRDQGLVKILADARLREVYRKSNGK